MQLRSLLIFLFLPVLGVAQVSPQQPSTPDKQEYVDYHRTIAHAQELIANNRFQDALAIYQRIMASYSFVFLRDYQAAAQLALQTDQLPETLAYIKLGMANGWTWKSIQKSSLAKRLKNTAEWKQLKKQYPAIHKRFLSRIDTGLRSQLQTMFRKDQWKALGALFTFSPGKQDRYAEKRFAPHSEKQMAKLIRIIHTVGFPSEQLIGNNYWATVIASHHNSISQRYVAQDTLYPSIRPKLLKALETGQISPYELATIEDWYVAVKSGRSQKAYGYLDDNLTATEVHSANAMREEIGLASVETINGLLEVQQRTGMNFHLPFRPSGKTLIR